jgi:Tfp pilus assembly protein FimT
VSQRKINAIQCTNDSFGTPGRASRGFPFHPHQGTGDSRQKVEVMNIDKMTTRTNHPESGFTMLEAVLVMLIALLMAAMAIPSARSALASYELIAAVDSVTGSIQATRYQAIMHGYAYQVDINSVTNQIQVSSEIPPATTFSSTSSAVPISAEAVTVGVGTANSSSTGHATLQFKPNGAVVIASGQASPMVLTVSYNGTTKTITVSNYGSISVQ